MSGHGAGVAAPDWGAASRKPGIPIMAMIERSDTLDVFSSRALCFSLAFVGVWAISLPSDLHLATVMLLVAVCIALMRVAFEFRHEKATRWRVVILGGGPLALRIAQEIETSGRLHAEPAGMVDDRPPQGPWPWLGRLDRLKDIVDRVHPNHIVVALEDRRGHLPLAQLLESRARGVLVEDALAVYERLTGKMAIEALTPGALIMTKGFRNDPTSEKVARLVSVMAAIVGLLLLVPLFAVIALAIKLDSRGPILFFQDRAGKNGQSFGLWKFRTMHPADVHRSEWVQDNFDRITRLGRVLRRFRIDELPQLVNILRGEMNLVGPRPHPMSNQEVFMERIAYYGLRSTVRPGVTGWAQIQYGYANNIDQETEKMRYDLYYIKNRSLWLDFTIIVRTFAIMLLGSGSSHVRSRVPSQSSMTSSAASAIPELALAEPVPVPVPVYDTAYEPTETTKIAEVAP
jgi:exopolysaccharide biosynthesis polyprenyl glycosylphosphotransferase